MKALARDTLNRLGLDIVRYPAGREYGHLLTQLLRGVDLVIDVGGRKGRFAEIVRMCGYTGRIVSYEALPRQAEDLTLRAAGDRLWKVESLALGDREETRDLYGAADLTSLLRASEFGRRLFRELEEPDVERVRVARLDSVAPDFRRAFLKVDTQGFDQRVLEGATGILDRIEGIQTELAIQSSYEGAGDYLLTLGWLRDRGFLPMMFKTISRDSREGRETILELDCLLRRR